MLILPSATRPVLKPDPEIARQRELCERLHDSVQSRQGDVRQAEARIDGIESQLRQLDGMQKAAAKGIRIYDWTGKTAAAAVVVGLATGSSIGLMGAAGLFIGGLAGFCASYLAQIKHRATWNACEKARGVMDGELGQAREAVRLGESASRQAEAQWKTAQDRLRTLEVTRMAEHANQGPPAGAVEITDDAVRLGGIRVPRNAAQ